MLIFLRITGGLVVMMWILQVAGIFKQKKDFFFNCLLALAFSTSTAMYLYACIGVTRNINLIGSNYLVKIIFILTAIIYVELKALFTWVLKKLR